MPAVFFCFASKKAHCRGEVFRERPLKKLIWYASCDVVCTALPRAGGLQMNVVF